METKKRVLLSISFEQLEEVLGLTPRSIRSMHVSLTGTDECLMVLTDDSRIAHDIPEGNMIPVSKFTEYPIRLRDDNPIEEESIIS